MAQFPFTLIHLCLDSLFPHLLPPDVLGGGHFKKNISGVSMTRVISGVPRLSTSVFLRVCLFLTLLQPGGFRKLHRSGWMENPVWSATSGLAERGVELPGTALHPSQISSSLPTRPLLLGSSQKRGQIVPVDLKPVSQQQNKLHRGRGQDLQWAGLQLKRMESGSLLAI